MRLDVDFTPSTVVPPLASDNDSFSEANSSKAKDALNEGIKAAQIGERGAARAALLKASDLDPANENVWLWLASISEYPEELMAFLEKVLAINPANERALQWKSATTALLAKTFVQRGTDAAEADQPMYAEDCFRKALEHDDANTTAWMWLASLTKDANERVSCLECVLAIDPAHDAAQNALNTIRAEEEKAELAEIKNAAFKGDVLEALNLLDHFHAKHADNAEAWMLKSHLALQPADKLAALQRVLDIEPQNETARSSFESLKAMFSEVQVTETVGELEAESQAEIAEEPDAKLQPIEEPVAERTVIDPFAEPADESISSGDFPSASDESEPVLSNNGHVPIYAEPEIAAEDPKASAAPEPEPVESVDPFPEDDSVSEDIHETFVPPAVAPNAELVFEPVDEPSREIPETREIKAEDAAELFASVLKPESGELHDWQRPTEAYTVSDLLADDDLSKVVAADPESVEAINASFAIPMPEASLEDQNAMQPERTGFETNVVRHAPASPEMQMVSCPFCLASNESIAISCQSCFAVLSLSDLELLIANHSADKFVIRKAVESMEKVRSSRAFDEAELTMLGIGHLNLRNLQYGYNYLLEASQMNPDNIVLSGQVNALQIRMEEIRRQDEAHAAMAKGKKILVVDDSATVRKLIAGKLEKCGHEVFCSSDGVEAIERLQDLVPDLVLLDITMPRMDGYQVCRQIRGRVATTNIPVVMISGKDGFFDKVRGRMAGTTGYITKPFGPETLMKAVEFYLGGGKDAEDREDPVPETVH